jgi:alkanesulfonate monooxygenase SsuD/methylene tetrahydromethanopterin reductase-like flavin-dependent oxidoreductase (luciferase family)
VASWGSPAGLRGAARLGDGWIASAYNVTPEQFGERLRTLRGLSTAERPLPDALATAWTYVSEDPAEVCAQRLTAFAAAGVERVMLWPLADEVRQLGLVRERVGPRVLSPG